MDREFGKVVFCVEDDVFQSCLFQFLCDCVVCNDLVQVGEENVVVLGLEVGC